MSGLLPETGTYLDAIVADVRRRLDDSYREHVAGTRTPLSLISSIEQAARRDRLGVIAEVKRRSPSKGDIDVALDPATLASRYVEGGACAISVLTEPEHFGGSLVDLDDVRAALPSTPLLRKDFMIDERQFDETMKHEADVVLVIAALYPEVDTLVRVVGHARNCGFEVLLEVHDEVELERALATDARAIGINNRDLRTFAVDLAVTERLAPQVPDGCLVVSESGISAAEDAARVRAAGAHAVLVGEALVRSPDPARLVHDLGEAGR